MMMHGLANFKFIIQRDSKRWTQFRKSVIHVVGRSFCLYTDSLFAQIGDSNVNALPRWRLNVETKTKRTLHSSRRLSFNELTKGKKSFAA